MTLFFFRSAMEPGTGMIDDLASLSVLDEKTLLEELRIRYSRDIIYVSTLMEELGMKYNRVIVIVGCD